MCYLVAKDTAKHGCYALKTMHGKHLVELKRFLNELVAAKGIQLVTISRPTAFGEYAPYHLHRMRRNLFLSSKRCEHSIFKAPRLNGNVQEGSLFRCCLAY